MQLQFLESGKLQLTFQFYTASSLKIFAYLDHSLVRRKHLYDYSILAVCIELLGLRKSESKKMLEKANHACKLKV